MQEFSILIDIRHLEMSAFLQAQATGVNGGQAHPVAGEPDGVEHTAHFCQAEDDGEFFFAGSAHEGQSGPRALQGLLIEELDPTQGDGAGGAGVMLDVFEEQKVTAQFLLAEAIRCFAVMLRQLPHGADIHLLSPLRHAL